MQEFLATKIWTKYSEKVNMEEFQPVDHGLPFTLFCLVQQMLVQVQNLYELQQDQLRDQLTGLCKIRPRTYKEI